MTHVFLRPDYNAVMFDFPVPPSQGTDDLRQRYIEVFLTPWPEGEDPDLRLAEYVAVNPVDGRRIEYIDGHAVLIQEPRSSDDSDLGNPAFIRFVRNGLDIQIYGGASVELLKEIAESLTPR